MKRYWMWRHLLELGEGCVIAFVITEDGATDGTAVSYLTGHADVGWDRVVNTTYAQSWVPVKRCAMRKHFKDRGIDYDRSL